MPEEIDLNETEEIALDKAWEEIRSNSEIKEEPLPEEPVNDIKSIRMKYRKKRCL